MLAYLIAIAALVLSCLFLARPFVLACGGKVRRIHLYLFHLGMAVLAFLLARQLLQ